jgi:hypothetical protein
MATTGREFGILDLVSLVQETGAIQPMSAGSPDCNVCGRPHFCQWFRGPRGQRFYVCPIARHATIQDTGGTWRIVGFHDLARWLVSSLISQRAA